MNNHEKLLAVALDLFSARGYDAVGIQEIVDAAGVTKPTLYHYFISKRGLLQALLEHGFAPLQSDLQTSAAYQGDLTLTLEKVIRTYFQFAQKNPAFYRLQLGMAFAPVESDSYQAVASFSKIQINLLEKLFSEASRDHGNMRGRAPAYAATFFGMINTYISLALEQQIKLDDALIYRAQHQFMHGIFS
jgi:TetR/AcrR family transcriptional regulator